MDAYSGKREVNKTMAPKRGCNNMSSKSLLRERDQNPQFCNRIGCSGRIKYGQNKSAPSLDISKPSKVAADSSSSTSVITTSKNPSFERKRKLPSKPRCDSSESGQSSDSEASEPVSTPTSSNSSGYRTKLKIKSENIMASEAASSSGSSNTNNNPRRAFDRKTTVNNRNTLLTSSVSGKRTSVGPVSASSGNYYGLRNLNCSSISDIVQPSSSSSGKNIVRKRSQEGERNGSSLRGGRKINISSPSSSSSAINGHVSPFSSVPSEDTNRAWTRRSTVNINPPRTGFSRPVRETRISDVPGVSDNLIPFRVGGRSSSRQLISNVSSTASSSNSLARYDMNDIAEVLFALEMIEQDEELTHEQVRVLEASLLLGGLNLYDQHRDMRLDIDNMSYEELLALEERMGTVTTALSEEEISKCLIKGTYEQTPPFDPHSTGDDAKCSICQEEYDGGDETGTIVECKHGYHMCCVMQWLRLKNWCPVCKGSAVSPP